MDQNILRLQQWCKIKSQCSQFWQNHKVLSLMEFLVTQNFAFLTLDTVIKNCQLGNMDKEKLNQPAGLA